MNTETVQEDVCEQELPAVGRMLWLFAAGAGVIFVVFVWFLGRRGEDFVGNLDKACAEVAFHAGKKYEERGNYDQAIASFRDAFEGEFRDPALRWMCGRSIGDLLYRQGRYADAIDAYDALPAEAFEAAGSYAGYVGALVKEGDVERAEELGLVWLGKARAEQADDQITWALVALGTLYKDKGAYDKALPLLKEAAERDPDSHVPINVAQVLAAEGKRDEAVVYLQQVLDNPAASSYHGDARVLLDELDGE